MNRWPLNALSECCDIVAGATPDTSVPDFWGGGICWATPKDLSALETPHIADTPRTLTKAGLKSCPASVLPIGSVLFSTRAPIGHVAINTTPMATNQGFKSFIPDPTKLHGPFLYWWLRTHRADLERLGNGATFKEISKAAISRVQIPLPPLPEQRRIAAVLDRAEALRAKRRATNGLLDSLAPAVLLAITGDPRYNESGLRRCRLGDLAMDGPQNGLYKPASAYGSGTRIVRIDSFYDGMINPVESLKRVQLDDHERAAYSLRPGDVLINRVNSGTQLGKCALVPPLNEPVVFESNMMRLRVDETLVLPAFLVAFMQTGYVKSQIATAKKDAVNQSSINQTDVCNLLVNLPSIEVQRRFVATLTRIAALRGRGNSTGTTSHALFASLQHRAFRGEL